MIRTTVHPQSRTVGPELVRIVVALAVRTGAQALKVPGHCRTTGRLMQGLHCRNHLRRHL